MRASPEKRAPMSPPTHRRSPVATALRALTIVAAVSAVTTLLYGLYMFPDAPIRAGASGYVGKAGTSHTAQEFERFLMWERAMLIAFAGTFLFGFAYEILRRRL